MSTKHTLRATIPHGDPDLGAEVEVEIAFTFLPGSPDYYNKAGGHWEQGWGVEIEFIDAVSYCNGKPSPHCGAFADLERKSINALAEVWLESDEGRSAALDAVAHDDECAREYVAELRADVPRSTEGV